MPAKPGIHSYNLERRARLGGHAVETHKNRGLVWIRRLFSVTRTCRTRLLRLHCRGRIHLPGLRQLRGPSTSKSRRQRH